MNTLDKLCERYYKAKKPLNFPAILRELVKDYNPNSFNAEIIFKDLDDTIFLTSKNTVRIARSLSLQPSLAT